MEVEGVVAHPPGHGALLAGLAGLVGLALDAQIHDVVPTDGAVVHLDVITIIIIIIHYHYYHYYHLDVPSPKRGRIPFFDFEPVFLQHFLLFWTNL